jgi:hypothetical protein
MVAAWIDTDIAMEFRYIKRMMGFVLELEFVGIGTFGRSDIVWRWSSGTILERHCGYG